MTIITTTQGGKTRRCDAKCYNAKGKKCTCIYGGRNHGVGLNIAINQSADWLTPASLDYPGPEYKLSGSCQLWLFGDPRGQGTGAPDEQGDHPPGPLQGEYAKKYP